MKALIKGLVKSTGQALIGFILVGVLAGVAQESYYRFLNGSWFLSSTDVKVQSAEAGQNVPFEWCRAPRHGAINAQAVRSFYRLNETTNKFEPVAQYEFTATIEEIEQDCQPLVISPERQPQQDGTYYFTTDLTWHENDYEKKLSYRSNPYNLISTPESLTDRIKVLEAEIDRLETRLRQLNAERGIITPETTETDQNQTGSTSSSNENSNVAQSQEQPEAEQTPQNSSIIEETPSFIDRVTNNIRKMLGI